MNATELMGRYKYTIIVAITIIVILLGIYYFGKKSGKTESTTTDLPKDTDWAKNELTATENEKIKSLTLRLYRDLKGLTLFPDSDLWSEFFYSTDRIFVGTYNYFNQKYEAEGDGTLKEWINDEFGLNMWLYKSSFATFKESILFRMDNLNLV